ncbi:MAG: DUF687 family protein, partial [Victivallaceae bacterium]
PCPPPRGGGGIGGLFPRLDLDAVRLLQEGWDDWFEQHPGEPRLQFCAGASTATVAAALEGYQQAYLITVVAIAPSTIIPRDRCHRIVYYRSRGDLTSLSGSLSTPVTIVERHPESIGCFDNCFASSTFITTLRYEWLLFSGENPAIPASVGLRGDSVAEHVVIAEDFEHALRAGILRQEDIENLYEGAFGPPHPNDPLSWSIAVVDTARQTLLAVDAVFLMRVFSGSLRLHLYNGFCLLVAVNTIRNTVLVYVPRSQNRRNRARTLALRTGFMETVQALYGPAFLWAYALNPSLMPVLRIAYGILAVYFTPAFFVDQSVVWISPLRGRLQTLLVGSSEETAVAVRSGENSPAARVGFARGVEGTVLWGIAGQIVGVAANFFFNLSMYPSLETAFGGTSFNATTGDFNATTGDFNATTGVPATEPGLDPAATAYAITLALCGALGLTSMVLNSISLSRMLRNRPQELVVEAPEHRGLVEASESDSEEEEEEV